jgi:hypothetical protein
MVQGASKEISNKSRHQQVACAPNTSSSVPPPAPKLPEVAYHDDSWKMPVNITHSYPPQPLPSQGLPLSLPFETWPGYGTPNAIQNFPSAVQSQPSLATSEFTTDYYSDLHNPQIALYNVERQRYTIQSQEQEFGESFTGDHGTPPYNGNGPWNWVPQCHSCHSNRMDTTV